MNPQSWTTTTEAFDTVFLLIFVCALVMLLGITLAMIYFIIRYNRKRHPLPTSQTDSNIALEIVWTVIPTILVMGMFYYGWAGYLALRNVPDGAMEVTAIGRKWSWTFEYENGRTSDRLYVPVTKPIKVTVRSEDVLHSFYIPAFRVKRDAVPGMDAYLWFTTPLIGSYDVFCAEYCGVGHSNMITTVEALSLHEFEEWYGSDQTSGNLPEGQMLLKKYGCLDCHSLDGTKKIGPSFKDLWGREVKVSTDDRERILTVDAEYIKRSVLTPQADLVVGYPPAMTSFKGRIRTFDLEEIIEYFKHAAEQDKTLDGEKISIKNGCMDCHSTDGSRKVGPTFKGIFGRRVTVIRDGKEVTIETDDEYLKKAIRRPKDEVVKGYRPVMPDFDHLTANEIQALVEYMKKLK